MSLNGKQSCAYLLTGPNGKKIFFSLKQAQAQMKKEIDYETIDWLANHKLTHSEIEPFRGQVDLERSSIYWEIENVPVVKRMVDFEKVT